MLEHDHTNRREMGATQEALAEAAGVTVQAVSKWENGGAPDTALLPAIADFFAVPMDTLFGRDSEAHTDIRDAVRRHLMRYAAAIKDNPAVLSGTREMTRELADIIWAAFCLFNTPDLNAELKTYAQSRESLESLMAKRTEQSIAEGAEPMQPPSFFPSRNIVGGGSLYASLMGLPYFMVMPEPDGGLAKNLPDLDSCAGLFKSLANPDTLRAVVWLCTRPFFDGFDMKPFTAAGMGNELGFSDEQADTQIKILQLLRFITEHELELEETVRYFKPTVNISPVLPLLAVARELLSPDVVFAGHRWNNDRLSLL